MNIHATAGPDGTINITVSNDDGSGTTIDLNYLLATKLYKAGYPIEEEYRLKNAPRVAYDHANSKN